MRSSRESVIVRWPLSFFRSSMSFTTTAKYTPTSVVVDLLEKAGEYVEYETALRYLVWELKCREMEFMSRLKAIAMPEQWNTVIATLLEDEKHPVTSCSLQNTTIIR